MQVHQCRTAGPQPVVEPVRGHGQRPQERHDQVRVSPPAGHTELHQRVGPRGVAVRPGEDLHRRCRQHRQITLARQHQRVEVVVGAEAGSECRRAEQDPERGDRDHGLRTGEPADDGGSHAARASLYHRRPVFPLGHPSASHAFRSAGVRCGRAPTSGLRSSRCCCSPSLVGGLVLDDHVLQLLARADPGSPACTATRSACSASRAAGPNNQALMDQGALLPWWSDPHHLNAFFRPLSSLTHVLDFKLWPDARVADARALAALVLRAPAGARARLQAPERAPDPVPGTSPRPRPPGPSRSPCSLSRCSRSTTRTA